MAKILIAEDDTSMLSFLKLALERAGHIVLCETNGIDALATFIKENDIDLLLTDIVIPGIDGIELAKKITNQKAETKVMFITGFAAMAIRSPNELKSQNTKTMSKPFHLNDLVIQIDEILKKED